MTRNDFHKGWQIMIFDAGLPGASRRLMSAVKDGEFLDLGNAGDDERDLIYARKQIDSIEKRRNGEQEK